ncbi:hypothetical protein BLA29_010966, partial [Euroglyphus maynei]
MSLSSYPNSNGTCKKSSLMNATKLNGKVHLSYEKNGMINNNGETEPLYEQTNFATATGGNHQPLLLNKAATFHKSPHHQRTVIKQSTIGDTNLLETIDLTSSTATNAATTVNQHQDQDQSNESYSFEPIFDHRDPMIEQYFKTLQTRSYHHHHQQQQQHSNNSSQSSHLYQIPEQVKREQQQQQQQQ